MLTTHQKLKWTVAAVMLATAASQGEIIYVDDDTCPVPGSGTELDPYCSIQTAIDNAVNGDVVIVAVGLYFDHINFNGKAITVRSTDPDDMGVVMATIISGGEKGTVVTCDSGDGSDTILSGFVITGGNANFGGGMLNSNGSSPTVTNCRFSGNTAVSSGGGMFNISGSEPTVINCTFIKNIASNPNSTGGGMANFNSNPTVTNCTFEQNTADGGGGMFGNSSSPTVINCAFVQNTSVLGGGMVHDGGFPTVTNCTFSGNTADSGGGILNVNTSNATVTNCILWGDSPDEVLDINTTTTVIYSDVQVQGGFLGTGNIDADPLFVDPDNGDYRLQSGSPCIDAGNNWGVLPDTADLDDDGDTSELTPLDLDRLHRFNADEADFDPGCGVPVVVDMGAYEYQLDPVAEVLLGDITGDGTVGINDLLSLLAAWGPCDPGCCLPDLDIDGTVGITDLLILLANWS